MFHVLVHQRSRSKPYLNLCLLAHSNLAKITLCAFHGTVSSEIFIKLSYALCMCMHEKIIELALSAAFQETWNSDSSQQLHPGLLAACGII